MCGLVHPNRDTTVSVARDEWASGIYSSWHCPLLFVAWSGSPSLSLIPEDGWGSTPGPGPNVNARASDRVATEALFPGVR